MILFFSQLLLLLMLWMCKYVLTISFLFLRSSFYFILRIICVLILHALRSSSFLSVIGLTFICRLLFLFLFVALSSSQSFFRRLHHVNWLALLFFPDRENAFWRVSFNNYNKDEEYVRRVRRNTTTSDWCQQSNPKLSHTYMHIHLISLSFPFASLL